MTHARNCRSLIVGTNGTFTTRAPQPL